MCWLGYIYEKDTNGVELAHAGAVALQRLKHRWSDSAWAILSSGTEYTEIRTNLWVTDDFLAMTRLMRVFRPQYLEEAKADCRLCLHTRYTTNDDGRSPHNAQPKRVWDKWSRLKIAFNGNIPNHLDIRRDKLAWEVSFQTLWDTETLARFMLHRILKAMGNSSGNVRYSIREAVKEILDTFRGGYSVVWDFWWEVFAFKDKYGIRPLALWKKKWSIIMASENSFFPEINYERLGELPNGHLLFVWPDDDLNGEYSPEPENLLTEAIPAHPDSFEFLYLLNKRSEAYWVSVAKLREDLGYNAMNELLQTTWDHQYKAVVSVPHGADDMRIGACRKLGIPSDAKNWLEKVADVRSFMALTSVEREKLVRMKFRVHEDIINGTDLTLLDDSIVRWNTMQGVWTKIREAWARSITVLSASPVVKYGDRYGIAMSTDQLIARDPADWRILTSAEIEQKLFFDRDGRQWARLFFPSLEWFKWVFRDNGLPHIHAAYFDGNYIHG